MGGVLGLVISCFLFMAFSLISPPFFGGEYDTSFGCFLYLPICFQVLEVIADLQPLVWGRCFAQSRILMTWRTNGMG
jgi:hypothetical protein